MEKNVNFVSVSVEKVDYLCDNLSHVRSLFKEVQIRLLEKNASKQWVSISCSTKNKTEELEKAKDYINALCSTESVMITLHFDDYSVFKHQKESLADIEKNFGVVANFDENQLELRLKGSELNVVLAKSWILKNPISLSVNRDGDHDVVTEGSINPSLKEFALKLGYSEKDVDSVAKKFGFDVDQNTLLRELIHFKACNPSSEHKSMIVPRGQPSAGKAGQIVARGARPTNSSKNLMNDSFRSTETAARGICTKAPYMDTQGLASCETDILDCLLPVVIDGSNVAMNHGNQQAFSCRGIELCINWFKERGHKEVYALVPQWRTEAPRSNSDYLINDQHILLQLAHKGLVKFTPSRRIRGRNIVCYDDRFIVDLAYKNGGVIVSNDNYRDLQRENPSWKDVIENRLLMYSFVGDFFMVPNDPLGKYGPTLDEFLQKGIKTHPRICPHISRCTYGSKCRFYHPERDARRRQELLCGKQHQVGKVYDSNGSRSLGVTSQEISQNRQQTQPYTSTPSNSTLPAVTTRHEYTYWAPYNPYNNSSCPSNNTDEAFDLVYAKLLEILDGRREEDIKRVMQKHFTYHHTEDLSPLLEILLTEEIL